MAARAVLLLLAIVAAGWLASGYPGAGAEARAEAIRPGPGGELTPAQVARAIDLYEQARDARPDGAVVPRLAGLLVTRGDHERAAALLRPLVEDEPENVTAWAVLAAALAQDDPAAARAAEARRRALAPPVH